MHLLQDATSLSLGHPKARLSPPGHNARAAGWLSGWLAGDAGAAETGAAAPEPQTRQDLKSQWGMNSEPGLALEHRSPTAEPTVPMGTSTGQALGWTGGMGWDSAMRGSSRDHATLARRISALARALAAAPSPAPAAAAALNSRLYRSAAMSTRTRLERSPQRSPPGPRRSAPRPHPVCGASARGSKSVLSRRSATMSRPLVPGQGAAARARFFNGVLVPQGEHARHWRQPWRDEPIGWARQ
ncbi:hypothetical protein MPTK1_3g20960 [Marchantia polymorpha subsp. ruderalis]|uniref:Uncharacterized protein n=2 Tax=Marchantia polymorpha TaxID=3197 RepID=A0AAF6B332_MARPO|nr:hypothetical protein MARPO_0159s0026 [Marchantia polymorpha]BBN06416.1 hypothetical protein Mp_3g20960 [Marchantia polymorpha subsp. ruderalis]|eukprot:PTQ28612.1 hypothetical protein MARPO_0159s0026 [Marchantia polymorpha]